MASLWIQTVRIISIASIEDAPTILALQYACIKKPAVRRQEHSAADAAIAGQLQAEMQTSAVFKATAGSGLVGFMQAHMANGVCPDRAARRARASFCLAARD